MARRHCTAVVIRTAYDSSSDCYCCEMVPQLRGPTLGPQLVLVCVFFPAAVYDGNRDWEIDTAMNVA